jgi:integrase
MYPTRKRKGAPLHTVLDYTLPVLHTGNSWYVDFRALDPVDGVMKRKRYMLNGIAKISDRKKRAAELIARLTTRLYSGWNPWTESLDERCHTEYYTILDLYIKYLSKLNAAGVMKTKTLYDYQSRLKVLREYNDARSMPIRLIYQFDQAYISDFLDYVLLDRDASARTRNNYRTWLSAFCSWLAEKRFIGANPVEGIRTLAEEEKHRSALTVDHLKKLQEYLREVSPHYLLACMMEYYTFIRPDELSNIRLSDIRIKEQKVFVSSAISKNRRDGMVGLNDRLLRLMLELGVFGSPGHYYLFGKGFRPSETKADSRIFREEFVKVRLALHFPDCYQFYSLKDSGIRDLANAEGIVVARDQARHTDISTTNKYLKADAMTVHEVTKHYEGNL